MKASRAQSGRENASSPRRGGGEEYIIRHDAEDVIDAEKESAFRFEKPLKKLIAALAVLLAAECIWLFIVSPCMPFSAINVYGLPSLDKGLVLSTAGITPRSSYMSTHERQMELGLLRLPQIKKAVVSKRFPDTLNLTLEGRSAVAFSLAQTDKTVAPVFFDEEGVVFQIGAADGAVIQPDSPVISGLFPSPVQLGDRAPALFAGFLKSLKEISAEGGGLLSSVSEIRVNVKTFNTFDLLMYPKYNQTKIRMSALNEEKLRYMLLLLDVFEEEHKDVEEIDFRTGTASYKIRGKEGIVYER